MLESTKNSEIHSRKSHYDSPRLLGLSTVTFGNILVSHTIVFELEQDTNENERHNRPIQFIDALINDDKRRV